MPNQGWWQRSSLTESETERRLSLSLLSRADSALAQARCGRVAEAEAAPDGAAMLGVGSNKLKAGLTAACARFTPDLRAVHARLRPPEICRLVTGGLCHGHRVSRPLSR